MRVNSVLRQAHLALVAILGLLALPATAQETRTENLRWTHPDAATVDHFEVHYGPHSRNYTTVIDDLRPTPDGQGIYRHTLTIPETDSIYVVIRAVDNQGRRSIPSNESYRQGVGGPPPPPPPPPPPSGVVPHFRINAGGPQVTDVYGQTWASDSTYAVNGKVYDTTETIAGTEFTEIYRTQRSGNFSVIGFDVPIQNGTYKVRLHFTETWDQAFTPGGRVFDVEMEGNVVVNDLDIYSAAGAALTSHVEEHTVTISDGVLDIDLRKQVSNPRIEGIEILRTRPNPPRLVSPGPPS